MEFIGHIIIAIFVALILAAALTFGFMLFAWFLALAAIISACVLLRQWWRRWWFVHSATREERSSKVIEVDYRDISDEE